MVPMADSHKAAILAALSITDELFQARQGDREAAARLDTLAEQVARLLPPAKRGRRAKGTVRANILTTDTGVAPVFGDISHVQPRS